MRKLISTFLAVLSFSAHSAEVIETPAFKLKLEGSWTDEQSSDPEQKSYFSKKLDVGITTSYMFVSAKTTDTERIANKLKEFRLDGENKMAKAFDLHLTIAEPVVIPFSKGHQVAYFGHDNTNRQFRYLGLVLPKKTINIYAESKTKSQKELEDIFNQLLKGLSF